MTQAKEKEKEKLIAKIQLEYATEDGLGEELPSHLDWDFGLLYLTNKGLWFVNRKQERLQIPFGEVRDFGELREAEGGRTKFSSILNATHMLVITYRSETDGSAVMVVAAAQDVLAALRSQLQVRAPKREKSAEQDRDLELNKKISVLLYLGVKDDEALKYMLGVSRRELVSLVIARSRFLK